MDNRQAGPGSGTRNRRGIGSTERAAGHRRAITATTVMIAGVGLLAACGAVTGSSSGGGGSSSTGSLKGKTITLIAPDKPGGSYDSYARLFAPYLAKELGATVNVENVAGAGTVEGTNQMAAAKPDGTTIGMAAVGGDIASKVENQPGQSFDMAKLSWIGQPAQVPNVMVTQPKGPVQNFSALTHMTGTVQVLDIRNGIGDMLNRVVLGAFHVPYHLNTGFESTSALKQGFIAKDGQTMFEAMSTLHSLIKGHQAKPLLVTAESTLPSYQKAVKGVPTLQTELSSASLSSTNSAAVQEALQLSNMADDFAAPPGTPASTLAALRAAFTKAANSPALQTQATKENLPIAPTDGATLSGQVATALQQANAIAPFVNRKTGQ